MYALRLLTILGPGSLTRHKDDCFSKVFPLLLIKQCLTCILQTARYIFLVLDLALLDELRHLFIELIPIRCASVCYEEPVDADLFGHDRAEVLFGL